MADPVGTLAARAARVAATWSPSAPDHDVQWDVRGEHFAPTVGWHLVADLRPT